VDSRSKEELAREAFRRAGGILRTRDALAAGIHPRTLYAMRNAGQLETLTRGVYRLADMPPLADPDLATVAARVPAGVVCLISALSFHDLTTQIPHEVFLALPRGARPPVLNHPPLQILWFNRGVFEAGIERHKGDGVEIKVYSPEKTVADCFKFRDRVGLDVAVEGLRRLRERAPLKIQALNRFARIDGVERVMRPYVEALL